MRTRLLLLCFVAFAALVSNTSVVWLTASAHRHTGSAQNDSALKSCEFQPPGASFSVPYVAHPRELNTNPSSATWADAASTWIEKDCSKQFDYRQLKTEVRAFWTDRDLYLLFICPYTELNLWLPPDNSKDRLKLWDRDVVEFFLGDDWVNIRHYREFEVAPTGDWVDLAIDLDHDSYGADWNSSDMVRSGSRAAELGERRKSERRHQVACELISDRRIGSGSATPFHVLATDLRRQSRP
jgi:hypothetical protein